MIDAEKHHVSENSVSPQRDISAVDSVKSSFIEKTLTGSAILCAGGNANCYDELVYPEPGGSAETAHTVDRRGERRTGRYAATQREADSRCGARLGPRLARRGACAYPLPNSKSNSSGSNASATTRCSNTAPPPRYCG